MRRFLLAATLALSATALHAQTEVKVGVILSTTGPAASLGIFERNGVALVEAAGKAKVKYLYVDDASDPTMAVRLAQRLITEEKVDAIIGTTVTPAALGVTPVAADAGTPVISQAPSNVLVQPVDGPRKWIFKTTTNDDHEARPLFAHMKKAGTKTLGFIGFSDSYGQQWLKLVKQLAQENGIEIVAVESYARTDSSVASQVLKLSSKTPDAVLVAASGGSAATPVLELKKRNYAGRIYVTLGATFGDFLKIAGPDAEGLYAPFAAVMGVSQVPDANPGKAGAIEFVQTYDAKYGAGTANIFAAGAWDAARLIEHAIPIATKKGQPGTPEFRAALRDALEGTKDFAGARGIYTMSTTDHAGLDAKALLLGRYQKGRWVLQAE